MSIRVKALRFLEEILDLNNIKLKGLKVCTIGNLNTKRESRDYMRKNGKRSFGRFQNYLENGGSEVVVIDINPLGGTSVLHYDLGRPILDPSLQGAFDLVIDGGTGEHIDNQFELFNNIFNFLKVGGISINILPYHGYWEGHARWNYDFTWFETFVTRSKIQLIEIQKSSDCYGLLDRQTVYCAMRKTETTNIEKETFIDPYPDENGNLKNDKCYNRWVLPARINEKT